MFGKFESVFSANQGFRLCCFRDVFSQEALHRLSGAFKEIEWQKKQAYFYTLYKSYVEPTDQHALACFYHPSVFFPLKEKLENILGVSFQNIVRVIAHKLVTSDEIGVHNDYADPEFGYENFRFVVQFALPDQLVSGGELTFLGSRDRENVIKQVSYQSNSGVCFEVTPRSFHYVTSVEGERHTAVLYFWQEGRKYDGSGTKILDGHLG